MGCLELVLPTFHNRITGGKGWVDMIRLNDLERSVLNEIAKNNPGDADGLDNQIAHAVVKERKNTGSGFYTYLEVEGFDISIKSRVLSNAYAKVDGMENPMAFVLFSHNGKISILEGAATDDATTGINFSTAKFHLIS